MNVFDQGHETRCQGKKRAFFKLKLKRPQTLQWQSAPTWGSSDVHGFEVPGFDDSDGESTSRGQITQRKHQLPQVHVVLRLEKQTLAPRLILCGQSSPASQSGLESGSNNNKYFNRNHCTCCPLGRPLGCPLGRLWTTDLGTDGKLGAGTLYICWLKWRQY